MSLPKSRGEEQLGPRVKPVARRRDLPTNVLLPQWGMEMQEATIVKWLKKEGDPIEKGEPIVEVETAKLETEMEALDAGVLARINVAEGATVPIGTVLAVIAAPGEEVPLPAATSPVAGAAQAPAAPRSAPASAPVQPGAATPQVVPVARRLAQEHGIDLSTVSGSGPNGRIMIADVEAAIQAPPTAPAPAAAPSGPPAQVVPAARRLAQQHSIGLSTVSGSGPNGRVLVEDVEKAITGEAHPAQQVVPLRGMRQTIATRMLDSLLTTAQVTLTTEADVTDAMRLREGLARQMTEGGITPLAVVAKATAKALQEHPRMNAVQGKGEITLVGEINVGLAVALEEGLIVPTIRNANEKGLAEIARESRELANKARQGTATPDEVTGGTFTITNLGAFEIDAFTPIINPPQVGILGVGRAVEKPVVHNGEIVKCTMMYLSLTFDHRVIDGAPAADFLRTVKGRLEDPWWMVAS